MGLLENDLICHNISNQLPLDTWPIFTQLNVPIIYNQRIRLHFFNEQIGTYKT